MWACTNVTDIDPSPTADATRFTEPLRTSPAANTPGRLVSSRNGARPASLPALELAGLGRERAAGEHEAPLVQLDAAAEPVGVRIGADEEEEGAGWEHLLLAAVPRVHRPQVAVAVERGDAHPQVDRHVLQLLDPVHQVARHPRAEVFAPAKHVHVAGGPREIHDGLTRRVSATDHHDLLPPAEPRLHLGRGVVDARRLEIGEPWDVEFAVLHAARDEHAARADSGAVG